MIIPDFHKPLTYLALGSSRGRCPKPNQTSKNPKGKRSVAEGSCTEHALPQAVALKEQLNNRNRTNKTGPAPSDLGARNRGGGVGGSYLAIPLSPYPARSPSPPHDLNPLGPLPSYSAVDLAPTPPSKPHCGGLHVTDHLTCEPGRGGGPEGGGGVCSGRGEGEAAVAWRGRVLGRGVGVLWTGRACVGRGRGGCAIRPLYGSLAGSRGPGGRY